MTNTDERRRLWRATKGNEPHFGFCSHWTDSERALQQWTRSRDFGGPDIYTIEIGDVALLDLRTDNPWRVLFDRTGCDHRFHDLTENGHDLLNFFATKIASRGYLWIVHWQFGNHRFEWKADRETWIYLGDEELRPTFVRSVVKGVLSPEPPLP